MARFGREMGYTSHEVKRIFRELKHGNDKYAPSCKLCDAGGCRSGFIIKDQSNTKIETCPKCLGYGFYRKS